MIVMNLATTVLVVVDMQNGFITDESAHIIKPVRDLTRAWLDRGGVVIFTRFFNVPASAFERLIGWSRMQGPPETDLVSDLDALTGRAGTEVLDKETYSLFNAPGRRLVESNGWTDLAIVGIATESCVLKTAVDAFEADLNPWILTDAVYSHAGVEAHEAGLLVAGRFIGSGQLLESSDFLAKVLGPAHSAPSSAT